VKGKFHEGFCSLLCNFCYFLTFPWTMWFSIRSDQKNCVSYWADHQLFNFYKIELPWQTMASLSFINLLLCKYLVPSLYFILFLLVFLIGNCKNMLCIYFQLLYPWYCLFHFTDWKVLMSMQVTHSCCSFGKVENIATGWFIFSYSLFFYCNWILQACL